MKSLINKTLIIFIVSCLSLSTTYASSSGGSSRGGTYQDSRQNRKPIDQKYELGKAVYRGKAAGSTKLNYCIDNGNAKVKLKSRTAKAFKNKSANEFAASLFDCNKPDSQIASTLNKQDLYAVVYYFNKRFRLNLSGL